MDSATYRRLYSKLKTPEDVKSLAERTGVPDEVLLAIRNQKIVRNTRKKFHVLKVRAGNLGEQWSGGKSFMELSRELDFPPVLTASIILKHMGMGRREFWKLLKSRKKAPNKRITRELKEAVEEDFLYSPWAHELQRRRADVGEEILMEWLESMNVEFIRENDASNRLTPDFLLKEEVSLDGRRISWVESKASFGDRREFARHMRRQLTPYLDEFGEGMVIYWYGYLDSLIELEPRILLRDYKSFPEQAIELFRLSRW